MQENLHLILSRCNNYNLNFIGLHGGTTVVGLNTGRLWLNYAGAAVGAGVQLQPSA